jgi:hypothetical protein|tara:strand:+ start:408 stop:614 length:207 start_codon:yes stop_codon:yes gene_type:complete
MKKYSSNQITIRPTLKQEQMLEEIVNDRNYCYSNSIAGKSDIVRKNLDVILEQFIQDRDAYNFRRDVS